MRTFVALAIFSFGLLGCISKAKEAIAPEPAGVGTLSCREIVEQCDSQCSDPLCVNRCTGEGTQEAQGLHAALLDCGQRSGCADQACMEQSCPSEIAACMGPGEPAPAEPANPADPVPGPGQAPAPPSPAQPADPANPAPPGGT